MTPQEESSQTNSSLGSSFEGIELVSSGAYVPEIERILSTPHREGTISRIVPSQSSLTYSSNASINESFKGIELVSQHGSYQTPKKERRETPRKKSVEPQEALVFDLVDGDEIFTNRTSQPNFFDLS